MVSITHSGENIFRLNQILSAAQKHFGKYGLEKSTMREIASDLNISKGALYYYFSDKEQLYKAVVEKEMDEFFLLISEKVSAMDDPEEMLLEYLEIRMNHFRTVLNLSRFRLEDFCNLKPLMSNAWIQFQAKEVDIIEQILNLGIQKKLFYIDQPHEVAELFLDMLRGVRKNELHDKELFYLDQNEYSGLVRKINDILNIFIKGLKYKEN
jgi:AcrR family transcriptional regulator